MQYLYYIPRVAKMYRLITRRNEILQSDARTGYGHIKRDNRRTRITLTATMDFSFLSELLFGRCNAADLYRRMMDLMSSPIKGPLTLDYSDHMLRFQRPLKNVWK